jgi:hypothetical protein
LPNYKVRLQKNVEQRGKLAVGVIECLKIVVFVWRETELNLTDFTIIIGMYELTNKRIDLFIVVCFESGK